MATRRVPAASLVEDYDIYPRFAVNPHHVRRIADAFLAGVAMPPLLVEAGTLRLVDGFHRRRAALKAFGQDATVEVDERTYDDEAELVAEVIAANAGHGQPVSAAEMGRCLLLARKAGLDDLRIARCLNMTQIQLKNIEQRKIAFDEDGGQVPVKWTAGHLAQRVMSDRQQEGSRRAIGHAPLVYVNQVINVVENDLVDWNNTRLVEGLIRLHELLGAALSGHATESAA
jgi:ParB-like chromosome segregation protein Spo0J